MIKLTSVLAALVLIIGCSNGSKHEMHQKHLVKQNLGLQFNGKDKWSINEEMKPYMQNAQILLTEFKTDSDYKSLAENLREQNNALIKSCKMDGKSHDELHKWLMPHIELVSQLDKAETSEEAVAVIERLSASMQLFNTYFE